MKKQIWIVCGILIIIGVVVSIVIIYNDYNDKNAYSKVVGEYTNTDFVNKWEALGASYAVGMNAKGHPIFKNTDAAFEQAKTDYSEGFDYLHKYKHISEVSKNLSVLEKYKQEATQANVPITVDNHEEIKQQCIKIAQFVDVYENSFGDY